MLVDITTDVESHLAQKINLVSEQMLLSILAYDLMAEFVTYGHVCLFSKHE